MMPKRILLFCFCLVTIVGMQEGAAQLNDSLLREQLTRGVQLWKLGKPVEAYTTLDSVLATTTTPEIAATKVKAAVWTSTFLQQQKKYGPALKFLDSALTWAQQYARGEEYRRVYEAYADWHTNTGNMKSAMAARNQANLIEDSLLQIEFTNTTDSLKQLLALKEQELAIAKTKKPEKTTGVNMNPLAIGLSILAVILLLLVFRLNTSLQRMRTLPPAPQSRPANPVRTSEPVKDSGRETKVPETKMQEESPVVAPPVPGAPVGASLGNAPVNPKDLTVKLAEVELVLIRPDILGRYGNGEWKSVKNLLNEYLSQLPLILKNLDDAITKSETAPILQGLEYLKPYLSPFGMNSTLALIREVEEDADQVKASKLLSRVFQVRNHTRRAADEAKSILEKFS
jgi:hypothetical protein